MSREVRMAAVLKLTQHEPADLDGLLAPFDARRDPVGRDLPPCQDGAELPPLPLARADAVVVVIRVSGVLPDPADVAFRLAAFAIEQDVDVVVLSDLDYSGLERFGFRTERIAGVTEAERGACAEQIKRLWGVELTL